MRNAAEERRPAGVVGEIANDFTGNKGEIDREGLSRLLKFQFLRNESIGVAIGPVDVAVDGDRATAKFDVTFSDASQRWLPGGRETYAIVSGWRREGSRWICYNASWTHPT
ncbi:MAG TPA: nuclear transport factor 2 family protein [Rhodanobacteraceae bacterium]|nr:nuclear transport factor 2 family protein [Rhodanobacteraceae bacterium]